MIQYLQQKFHSGPCTAPRYTPPKLVGQIRDHQKHVSDLFAAQPHGLPHIVRQGHMISYCPGDRGRPPVI